MKTPGKRGRFLPRGNLLRAVMNFREPRRLPALRFASLPRDLFIKALGHFLRRIIPCRAIPNTYRQPVVQALLGGGLLLFPRHHSTVLLFISRGIVPVL